MCRLAEHISVLGGSVTEQRCWSRPAQRILLRATAEARLSNPVRSDLSAQTRSLPQTSASVCVCVRGLCAWGGVILHASGQWVGG